MAHTASVSSWTQKWGPPPLEWPERPVFYILWGVQVHYPQYPVVSMPWAHDVVVFLNAETLNPKHI